MVIARLRALTLFLIFSLESMLWLVEMRGARLRALTHGNKIHVHTSCSIVEMNSARLRVLILFAYCSLVIHPLS